LQIDTVFSMLGRYAHRSKSPGGSTHGPIDPVQMPEDIALQDKEDDQSREMSHSPAHG
jgi:hypothetical protein